MKCGLVQNSERDGRGFIAEEETVGTAREGWGLQVSY